MRVRWILIAALVFAAEASAADESIVARKFNHQAHISRGVDIGEACDDCHEPDPKGALVPVGKQGHRPCMSAGCHVTDFLAIEKEGTDKYKTAVAFCLGCHESAPKNFEKAKATAAFKGNDNPGYHVELDHSKHIERARCTECHVVDERSYVALYKPGHDQCAKCHSDGAEVPPMGLCSGCHEDPGRNDYFDSKARKDLDLKSCDSVWRDDMTAEEKQNTPCFRHERKEHRFVEGKQLQCDSCHYMVSKNASKFKTIKMIKSQAIIDGSSMDRYCGVAGCHPDVDSTKQGKCERCHHNNIRKKLLQGFVH